MPIDYVEDRAVFLERVTVEDAEQLLQWLQQKPVGQIDLSACTHLHPANLQVLLASGASVCAWPRDTDLDRWLQTVLPTQLG